MLGELELLGYSAYLHPIGADLLLGVGQDATPEGRTKGVQVSLFGVGDPAHPKLLAQHALGAASSSQVEFDSHAFLYWAPRQLVVLPVAGLRRRHGSSSPGFTGAVALTVTPSGIAEAGRVAHDPTDGYVPPITRSVVIGDQLLTVSDGGVLASALDGFGRLGWVAFPAPDVSPGPAVALRRTPRVACTASHRGEEGGGRAALGFSCAAVPGAEFLRLRARFATPSGGRRGGGLFTRCTGRSRRSAVSKGVAKHARLRPKAHTPEDDDARPEPPPPPFPSVML